MLVDLMLLERMAEGRGVIAGASDGRCRRYNQPVVHVCG